MKQMDEQKWEERCKRLRTFIEIYYKDSFEESVEEAYGQCILTPNDVRFLYHLLSITDDEAKELIGVKKPPLGFAPKKIWIQERQNDILRAINEYAEAGMDIPIEWVKEFNELCEVE